MGDYWSAVAPGAEVVGDDMMRRHGSCLASAMSRISLTVDRGHLTWLQSRRNVRTWVWVLNILGEPKKMAGSVPGPSVFG